MLFKADMLEHLLPFLKLMQKKNQSRTFTLAKVLDFLVIKAEMRERNENENSKSD